MTEPTTTTTLLVPTTSSTSNETNRRGRTRIFLRGSDLAKFVAFARKFEEKFGPDVMQLIKQRFADKVFLFTPQNALQLKGAMRWSIFPQEQPVLLDVEPDEGVLRLRDACGYTHVSVRYASVLMRRDTAGHSVNYAWGLDSADIEVPDVSDESSRLCSGFIRPFDGELWMHLRDQERGLCLEIKVCSVLKRMAWPPRIGCLGC